MEDIAIRENAAIREPPPPLSASVSKETKKKPVQAPVEPDPEAVKESVDRELVQQAASGHEEAVRKLAEGLNKFMNDMSYSLQFIPDKEDGGVVVKVLDNEGRVIRRIPPEEMASISAKVGSKTGLLVNESR
ncbi:MAG: flagellar protein FlaG [Pseudomonadota bacterium]